MNYLDVILVVVVINVIFVVVVAGFMYFNNLKTIKRSQEHFVQVHEQLKTGMKVQFAGGVIGKIVSIKDETCEVEVAKDVILSISRFAINQILDK